MTLLERIYWRRIFLGDESVEIPHGDEADFAAVDQLDPAAVLDAWKAERAHADGILDSTSFDTPGAGGQTVRFWVPKLINEYARTHGPPSRVH